MSTTTTTLTSKALAEIEESSVFTPPATSRFSCFFKGDSIWSPTQSQSSSLSDSDSGTPPASPTGAFDRLLTDIVRSPSSPPSLWNPSPEADPVVVAPKRSSGLFGYIGATYHSTIADLRRLLLQSQTECAQSKWERTQAQLESDSLRAQLAAVNSANGSLRTEVDHANEFNAMLIARNKVVERDLLRVQLENARQRESHKKALENKPRVVYRVKSTVWRENDAVDLSARYTEGLEKELEQLKKKVDELEGGKK